jgi:hypothetical protein
MCTKYCTTFFIFLNWPNNLREMSFYPDNMRRHFVKVATWTNSMTMASLGLQAKPKKEEDTFVSASKFENTDGENKYHNIVKRARTNSEDDETQSKKMRSKLVAGEKQADGSIMFDLSSKKLLHVRSWKSTVLVDIREYYDLNGEKKPGKKGISLTKEQWRKLIALSDDISTAIQEIQGSGGPGEYKEDTLSVTEENSVAFAVRLTIDMQHRDESLEHTKFSL